MLQPLANPVREAFVGGNLPNAARRDISRGPHLVPIARQTTSTESLPNDVFTLVGIQPR